MIRTRKEWWDWCMERGTSGEMVFDILSDWKEISNTAREELAAYAHEAWSGWMVHLFGKSIKNLDGSITIPAWTVERWQRLASTQYANLSEEEKESDRVEADHILNIIERMKSC